MDSTSYDAQWRAWPIAWSAVWVGALAAVVLGFIIGLIGFAVGAHESSRFARWSNVKLITLVFEVCGAFFMFVLGGWVAAPASPAFPRGRRRFHPWTRRWRPRCATWRSAPWRRS